MSKTRRPRVLVVLPTGTYRASDFIDAAAALEIEVAIASEEAPPLGLEDRFVMIDCERPETSAAALADLATSTPIDAIVAVDDAGVVVASLASEMIGLKHNPPHAAAATRNKAVMRRSLEAAEVPQPSFRLLDASETAGDSAEALGFPVVLKPLSLAASKGVIRADNRAEAEAAETRIRRILAASGRNPNEPLLVERFMSGPEVAVEGMLWDGEMEVLAVFDKPDPLDGPFFPETIYVTPSSLHPEVLDEIHRVAALSAGALGLTEGPIHAELRVTNGIVRVVEVAARTIGGLCGRSLRFGLMGTSLEALVLRQALGMRRGLKRQPGASGVMMLPIERAGTLLAVRGRDAALEVPGITDLEITMPLGEVAVPPPDGDRYLGFLFARGSTQTEVVESLRTAFHQLEVVIS